MPVYDAISWLPLVIGLTAAGLFLSWLAWRRSGTAAGLRGVSLSLLPLAAYLTGVLKLVWRVVEAALDWALHLAFSPVVWIGVGLAGLALVLYVVASRLADRAPRPKGDHLEASARSTSKQVEPSRRPPASPADEGFDEIEEILRKRGIS